MKTPLRYQFSEYDCGPACLQNAISYLFDREEIPPEVLRNISLYCLDGYSAEGISGKTGTSATFAPRRISQEMVSGSGL